MKEGDIIKRPKNLLAGIKTEVGTKLAQYQMPPKFKAPGYAVPPPSNALVPIFPEQRPMAQTQSPILQNLVATANLNCVDLDLKSIALKCRNAEYNPKRFAAVIMRMKDPLRTTALIFKTGKMFGGFTQLLYHIYILYIIYDIYDILYHIYIAGISWLHTTVL